MPSSHFEDVAKLAERPGSSVSQQELSINGKGYTAFLVNEDKKSGVNDGTQQFLESMSKNMLRSRYEVTSLSNKANDEMIIIVPSEGGAPPEPPTDPEPQPCISDLEDEINPYAE